MSVLRLDDEALADDLLRDEANRMREIADRLDPDRVYEEVMAMSEAELAAELAEEGETLESNAVKMRAIFEQAKAEADMRRAIRAWLKCPSEKRPSPAALAAAIEKVAAAFQS